MSTQSYLGSTVENKSGLNGCARLNGDSPAEPPDITIARHLIQMGVPVFAAERAPSFPHGGTGDTGYYLPPGWQETKPDESVLDDYRDGDALCAVMGYVYDVLDTDPRNGGDDSYEALCDALAGETPLSYGSVTTPSGGWHDWIAALGIGKHTGFWKSAGWNGLDLQGGRPDGSSVGFAFIPPTERKSKANGKVYAYTWDEPPEKPEPGDKSGAALSRLIVDSAGPGRTAGSKKGAAKDGTGKKKMLTQAELQYYIRHGIPEDEPQDVTLARCVWAWRVRNTGEEWAYQRWQTNVSKTTLTKPGFPFTRSDFDRHWKGADDKRSEQEADEREARRARGGDGEDEAEEAGMLVFTSAADITPEHVDWVWHHRLPLGTFSLSAGKGGAAKSLHAVWLVAMITLGKLPGCWKGKPRGVLWVTLEASPQKEVVPRLIAAGANLGLVEFVTVQADDDRANDHIKIFNPAHIGGLRKRVMAKNIGAIVLDPALDVLDGKIKTNDQIEVRTSISRIQSFAEELEILILGIAHFNKMNSMNDAIDRITGSAAFSQRVRAALVFAYNEEDDCFVISQGKNNWGPLQQPNLAFTAEPRQVGDGIETIRLKWKDQDYEHSVNDLLADKHKRKTSKQDAAYELIGQHLATGPQPKDVIVRKICAQLQCSPSTVEKAAKGLVTTKTQVSTGVQGNPGVLWSLPETSAT